jgi:hypothetical protein
MAKRESRSLRRKLATAEGTARRPVADFDAILATLQGSPEKAGAHRKARETTKGMIDRQQEFVRWWDETVQPHGGGFRGNQHTGGKNAIAVLSRLTCEAATGVTKARLANGKMQCMGTVETRFYLATGTYPRDSVTTHDVVLQGVDEGACMSFSD